VRTRAVRMGLKMWIVAVASLFVLAILVGMGIRASVGLNGPIRQGDLLVTVSDALAVTSENTDRFIMNHPLFPGLQGSVPPLMGTIQGTYNSGARNFQQAIRPTTK